jgi:hypothetical protein
MFAYFIGILSGVIVIKAYPDYFSFRRKGQEISFRTVIYLSVDGKPRVLGVGDDQMPVELNVRIDLFKTEESNIGSFDKAECLDAFFRYCIRSIISCNIDQTTNSVQKRDILERHSLWVPAGDTKKCRHKGWG